MPDEELIKEIEGEVELDFIEETEEVQLLVVSAGVISENLDAREAYILKEVKSAIENVKGKEISDSKKVVTYVNNTIKDLKNKRISVKNEYMRPVDALYKRIDEIIAKATDAIKPLELAISAEEERRLKVKRDTIHDIKAERFAKENNLVEAFIRQCTWFDNPKWIQASYTSTKITKEVDEKVVQIVQDLNALDVLNDGNIHAAAIAMNYQENGKLSLAITLRKQLEEAEVQRLERVAKAEEERKARLEREAEEKRKAEEERQARLAQKAAQTVVVGNVPQPTFMREIVRPQEPQTPVDEDAKIAKEVEAVVEEAVIAPVVEEDVRVELTVKGTRAKLNALALYMKEQGILFAFHKEGK